MDTPFAAYSGDEPYIFICYSHADSDVVFPELSWLREQDVNIWYDEGISGGRVWREEIGNAIQLASKIFYYISSTSLASDHCNREIDFALDEKIEIVPIYLEEVELTTDLRLGLGRVQALFRFDDSRYRERLLRVAHKTFQAPVSRAAIAKKASRSLLFRPGLFAAAFLAFLGGIVLYVNQGESPDGGAELVSLGISPFSTSSRYVAGLDYEIERRLSASQGLLARVSAGMAKREDYRLEGTLLGTALRLELIDRNGVELLAWTTDVEQDLAAAADSISRDVLVKLGRADAVVARFRQPIDPKAFRTYLAATASLRSSHTLETLENAGSAFQEVLNQHPQYAPAHAGLCMTFLNIYEERLEEDDFQHAEQHCHRALTLDDQNPAVHMALGMLYRETGQTAKAIDSFQRALKLAPYYTDAMRGLAETFDRGESGVEAERWFREAIRVEPSHWENYQALAIHLFQVGDFAAAITNFETALSLAPGEIAISNNLGAAHFLAGNYKEAVTYWERVAQIESGPQIYANLATSHFYQRQFEEARAMYEQASRLAPNDYRYVGLVGEVLYITNQPSASQYFEKALDMAQTQVSIDPGNRLTLSDMASYRAALGDQERARELIEAAGGLESEDLVVVYNIAVTQMRLGEKGAAVQALAHLKVLGYAESLLSVDANFDGLYLE